MHGPRVGRPLASTALALAPSGVIAGAATLALLLAWLGEPPNRVESCVLGVIAGIAIAPLCLFAIVLARARDRLLWCLVLIAATSVATIVGFAIWAQAASIACGIRIDCPLG